jgi:hypothetical protein
MQLLPSQLLTEKDGLALAASMLDEIEGMGPNELAELSIEAQDRDGKPQNNFVLKYLQAMKMHGNEAVLAGFAAALSDYLACPGTYASVYQEIAQEAQAAA